MATYTRPDKFIPINVTNNTEAYLNYVQKRMDLSAKGEGAVNMQYQKLLNLDLTHEDNKNKLNEFVSSIKDKTNAIKYDFSDPQQTKEVLSLFKPLTEDPKYTSVLLDNKFTKHYNKQFQLVDSFKQERDEKGNVGRYYSDYNYDELLHNYNKFKSGQANNATSWGNPYTYQPYTEVKVSDYAKKFHDIPDEYEVERVDPRTGVVENIKIKGKTPEAFQQYLDAVLSPQEKNQIAIEGRYFGRKIDDNKYEQFLVESNNKSIQDVENKIKTLKAFKTTPDSKNFLSDDEYNIRYNEYNSLLNKLKITNNELTNPAKIKEYIENKENDYAQAWYSQKIGNYAKTFSNFRESRTYESNSAIVSALNRDFDWMKFNMQLQENRRQFDDELTFKYRKEGMNPDGTFIDGESGGYNFIAPVSPDPNSTVEDYVTLTDEYEKNLANSLKFNDVNLVDDIYKELGLKEKNEDNDIVATQKLMEYVGEYNSNPSILKSLNPNDNSVRAKALKALASNETLNNELNAFKIKKQEVIKNLSNDIFNSINTSLKDMSAKEKLTYVNEQYNEWRVSDIWGGTHKPVNFKSLEEASLFFATNPAEYDRMRKNTANKLLQIANFSLNAIRGTSTLGSLIPQINKSYNFPSLENNVKQHYGELTQDQMVLGNKQVITKPNEVNTTATKQILDNTDREFTREFVKYQDAIKKQNSDNIINPANIRSIERSNGNVRFNFQSGSYSDKTGKFINDGDIISINVPDERIVVTDNRNASMLRTIKTAGEYKVNYPSNFISDSYTFSVKPITAGVNSSYILQLKTLDGKTITSNKEFTNPADAADMGKQFFSSFETEYAKSFITKLMQSNPKATKEDIKKIINSPEIKEQLSKELVKFANEKLYTALGQTNPYSSPLENILENMFP